MKPQSISYLVTMGDSFIGKETVDHNKILRLLSDLHNKSFLNGFTDGFAWSDHISARFISEFIVPEKKDDLDATDISNNAVRNYAVGELTAHDYSWLPSTNISCFFKRLILSTLAAIREKLLSYDAMHQLSKAHKEQTLIVEWSGANDLITVNTHPSKIEVDRAIKARIVNAEQLIKNGYRHFVLFNLPDLSLTPRYQAESDVQRANAHKYSDYFNHELMKACQELSETYPHCSIDVFDINKIVMNAYENPDQHSVDKTKPQNDFKIYQEETSQTSGYNMFENGIHLSASMHAELAEHFYERYRFEYNFSTPKIDTLQEQEFNISSEKLRVAFIKKYKAKLEEEMYRLFSPPKHTDIQYKTASLEEILQKALYENGTLSREVITELQWVDDKGNLNLNIPVLKTAITHIRSTVLEFIDK